MGLFSTIVGTVGLIISAAMIHNDACAANSHANWWMAGVIICGVLLFIGGRSSAPSSPSVYEGTIDNDW